MRPESSAAPTRWPLAWWQILLALCVLGVCGDALAFALNPSSASRSFLANLLNPGFVVGSLLDTLIHFLLVGLALVGFARLTDGRWNISAIFAWLLLVPAAFMVLPATALVLWLVADVFSLCFELDFPSQVANVQVELPAMPEIAPGSFAWARAIALWSIPLAMLALALPLMRWGALLSWPRAVLVAGTVILINLALAIALWDGIGLWFQQMTRWV